MDNLEFSEEEIQQQLELLGYKNISKEKLQEFKKDLDNLIRSGEWTTLVSPENSQIDVSNTSPPAFTKEKVSQCSWNKSGEGFFLHPQNKDHDVRVLSPQNRDFAPPLGRLDSYARHSVAPKAPAHVGRPNRLQTETDPDDTLQTDSYTSTPGSGHGRRLKRKVLRKHKGQSLVCDESVYSEDSERAVLTQVQLINPLTSEPPASRRSLCRSVGKMYKNQQEDAEDSSNSSFWSDKETEDEEDEVQPGFKTKLKSTEGAKEDVKFSDGEELTERFVADESKSKEVSNNETLDEGFLKEQDQNASKSSENYGSDDSWEECGSEEEIEEEIQDEEASKRAEMQNEIEIGEESSDILNTSHDEDETDNSRKTDKSASSKERRKRWKDFSDDSSENVETSSEDEAGTRSRQKRSSKLDKCGKKCEKFSGNSSGNAESSRQNSKSAASNTNSSNDLNVKECLDVFGETLDGDKVSETSYNDLKTFKNEAFKTQTRKEEMVKTTGENKSSENARSDDIESDFEKENDSFDISEKEDKSSQNGEDYNGSNGEEGDTEIQETKSKCTEDSLRDKLAKRSSEDCESRNVNQTCSENSKFNSNNTKSSQHHESEMDTSRTEEFGAKNGDSASEFTEGSLAKSSSNDVESGTNYEDGNDRKRLRKQDNFYDSSESGDITSDTSNGQNRCNQDESAIERSTTEEKTIKKYKAFSEDSSENGETDDSNENRTKGKVESENKMREKSINSVEANSETANMSDIEGDNGKDESEPSISRQNSQYSFSDDFTKDEEKLNKSQGMLDFEENMTYQDNNDQVEKEKTKTGVKKGLEIVNIGENVGRFNAQQCDENEVGAFVDSESTCLNVEENGHKNSKSSNVVVEKRRQSLDREISNKPIDFAQESDDNKRTCGNEVVESDGKIQKVLGVRVDNFQEEKFDKSSDAIQEKLENDKTSTEMSKDSETSDNLEESDDDEEEIERWFEEEEDSSEKLKETIQQNDLEGQDLDKMIQADKQNTSESPTISLLTSGYGTIRSEKLEDDRLTINEFDKDSLYSFGVCEHDVGEFHGSTRNYEGNDGQILVQDEFWDGRKSENSVEGKEEGRLEAQLCLEKVESSEEEEEEEGNGDIKFIDSKVDPSLETMYMEWEGNLRHPTGASFLEERLADLHVSTTVQHESENEELTSHGESPSSESLSEGAFESYVRGMSRSHSDGDIRPKPKSFIRPTLGPTGPKKTDPVAKYFQYKQLWDMFKTPGDDDRKALRWEIRERLAYQPPPPKPRKVLVPNTYTVPTEKKRSALRWEIRNDLATGNLPLSYNYRF